MVQVMARTGNKPLSGPMMTQFIDEYMRLWWGWGGGVWGLGGGGGMGGVLLHMASWIMVHLVSGNGLFTEGNNH